MKTYNVTLSIMLEIKANSPEEAKEKAQAINPRDYELYIEVDEWD